MKLEEGKTLQNVFKSNLNEISKGRFNSKELKSALENIKLLYKSQYTAIDLFHDYSLVASEAKYSTIHGQGIPSMSPRVAPGRVTSQPANICPQGVPMTFPPKVPRTSPKDPI